MRHVVIHEDVESGGWVAEVPSLPGCVSDGQTREEALANIRDAVDAWMEAANELGRSIPPDVVVDVDAVE